MKDAPRIKGFNAGKYGMPSKPLKSYSVKDKMEYLEGYSVGAWERRNDVANRLPTSPTNMKLTKEQRAIERERVAALRTGLPELEPEPLTKRTAIHEGEVARRRAKQNPAHKYFLCVQKHGGKMMTWNGERFTDNEPFKSFDRASSATRLGKSLVKRFPILAKYKVWVAGKYVTVPVANQKTRAMRGGSKMNPSKRDNAGLDMAAKKLEDFSGHPVSHLESGYSRSNQNTGLIVGELDLVGYRAKRDGKVERYGHHFKKNSRPLLAVTSDGKQLHIVGGQYEFTEAGIEDR